MTDSVLGNSIHSYQPLARMQEKAAQLRAELDLAAKGDRHAQFKRTSSKSAANSALALGGPGSLLATQPSSSPTRRFLRTVASNVHSVHSVHSTVQPNGGPVGAGGSSGSVGLGAAGASAAGGGGLGAERLSAAFAAAGPSPSLPLASRLSSRRISNASGAATEMSGEAGSGDLRSMNSGVKSPPSRRGSRPSRASVLRESADYAAAISRQNQLEDTVADLEDQVRELAADNERRQESYMRREAALQEEVARLEEQLRKARGDQPQNSTFGKAAANMRELHNQVVSQIEDLLTVQAASMRDEEHTTLRRFTTRLTELEAAVVAERNKAAAREDVEAAEKIKGLRVELDNMQHIAQILDKKHTVLSEENSRLRAQFKLQEDDRDYLIKQTVALKKENGALRNQLAALAEEATALAAEREELTAALAAGAGAAEGGAAFGGGGGFAAASGWGGGGGAARPASAAAAPRPRSTASVGSADAPNAIAVKIQRYEDVIDSLKRLLEAERRRTKQARAAHTLELQQRTGLQALIRQCVEDVRERRRKLEADEQRDRLPTDARGRPASALRGAHHPSPASPSAVSRPLSASPMLLAGSRRPASAAAGAAAAGGRLGGVGSGYAVAAAAVAAAAGLDDAALSASERSELIDRLLGNEEVLRVLFDKAFPGVSPHPPSDPYLERMAAWQEQRDAQVAANAKVLAAAKNAVLPPATAVKESTPGGMLLKEAANRPWVLNVDAMLSDFLGGTGGLGTAGGGPGGPGAGASSRSVGGVSAAASAGGGGGGAGAPGGS